MSKPTGEHRERLLAALQAAQKANNPTLVNAITRALDGNSGGVTGPVINLKEWARKKMGGK